MNATGATTTPTAGNVLQKATRCRSSAPLAAELTAGNAHHSAPDDPIRAWCSVDALSIVFSRALNDRKAHRRNYDFIQYP